MVYSPADGFEVAAALVAVQTERNVWDGMWTYDAGRIARTRTVIRDAF